VEESIEGASTTFQISFKKTFNANKNTSLTGKFSDATCYVMIDTCVIGLVQAKKTDA